MSVIVIVVGGENEMRTKEKLPFGRNGGVFKFEDYYLKVQFVKILIVNDTHAHLSCVLPKRRISVSLDLPYFRGATNRRCP